MSLFFRVHVNQMRLREDIEANATFGSIDADTGNGRSAMAATEANRDARDHLIDRMNDAGLEVAIDPIGNIEGRWYPDNVDRDVAPVAAGSHLDSVPRGGIFDGPLGVYAALEAVRTIQEMDVSVARPISVVSFTGEEGARFKNGLLGSSVVTGRRSLSEALGFTDDSGISVEEALRSIGYVGTDKINPAEWHAWLELHVEQDTTLERTNTAVGIVNSITGMTNCRVEIEGEANHAGATPMDERTDALAASSEFILGIEAAANEVVETKSETAVGTVGEIHTTPNSKSVVSGATEMIIDIRDIDYAAMNAIVDAATDVLNRLEDERNVSTSFDRYRDQRPSHMTERCVEAAITAAESLDVSHRPMHSAAMHDTAHVADKTNTVMLFAPSRDGISHNPLEWTDWKDCSAAADVLTETIRLLASK